MAALVAGALAVALAVAGCSGPGPAPIDLPAQTEGDLPADTVAELQAAVETAMAAAGAPGAIVGVWAPWSGSWVTGLGTTAVGGGDPVTTDMSFRVGALTRAMTCDALSAAQARGVLSADDDVTTWVGGVADLKGITLGELCDGSSGVGSYSARLTPSFLAKPDRVWDPRELAAYGIAADRDTDPGTAYVDSDAGYVLLGLALERATGMSAADVLAEYVFEPLGLENTSLPATPAAVPVGEAYLDGYRTPTGEDGAYVCGEPIDVSASSSSIGYTDSGVVSTIADVARYIQSVAAGSFLPEGVSRVDGALPAYDGAPSWYTAGGGVYQAGTLVGQAGSALGYATAAFADPTSGLVVVVVLDNSTTGRSVVQPLAWELAAIASKAPAASGQTVPEAGLPWTAEQNAETVRASAICPVE